MGWSRVARTALPWVVASTVSAATGGDAVLQPHSLEGWTAYVAAAEQRIVREQQSRAAFLGQDFMPDATARRRALMQGDVVVDQPGAVGADGRVPPVKDAMVHHWRGAVFIAGLTAHELVAALEDGAPGARQEDVLAAQVLERRPGYQRVFLRLQRTKFVTVVYNTEHEVRFARPAMDRAVSVSTAVRIAEVEHPGRPDERELTPGRDRGFLWRWRVFWRYQDVPGGVIVECESISLSRTVPAVVRYLAGPLIRRTARESMERTLATLRRRFVVD